jgi:hypothetical protein
MYGLDRFSIFVDKRPLNSALPTAGQNLTTEIITVDVDVDENVVGNSSSASVKQVSARRAARQNAYAQLPKLRLNEYNLCNYVTRNNYAIFSPHIHLQCNKPLVGRYIYIQADGRSNRWSRIFSAVICELQVYEL